MDAANPTFRYRRWLPYWAVLQTDVRQTLRSWVYLLWVIVAALSAGGYLLYRYGLYAEAGVDQKSSAITTDLFRWLTLGSLSLIVILAVGAISSERGTLADSVLSRGISRYQYYLAKWHARLAVVLGTVIGLFATVYFGSYLLLNDDLSLVGGISALLVIASVIAAVVSCGVMVGAMTQSTVLGITILGMGLAAVGISSTVLPGNYWSAVRSLQLVPSSADMKSNDPKSTKSEDAGTLKSPERPHRLLASIMKGEGTIEAFEDLFTASLAVSLASAGMGMIVFSRKDV